MEDVSFEEIFEEVSWELCMQAASMAMTDFSIIVYNDVDKPDKPKRAKTLEDAVDQLMLTRNGGVQISGTWRAGGKRGDMELVYVKLLSPTATKTFVLRFLEESIRLKIAKELMHLKNPDVELLGGSPGTLL